MNNETNILITLSNQEFLIKVAIKVSEGILSEETIKYPLEPENKEIIKKYLPEHCNSFGNIVKVEEIDEIIDGTILSTPTK